MSPYNYNPSNDLTSMSTSSGSYTTRYTQSRTVDEPLSEVRSGTTSYYEQDGLAAISGPVLANGNQGITHGLN